MKNQTTNGLEAQLLAKRKKKHTTSSPRFKKRPVPIDTFFGSKQKMDCDAQSAVELVRKRNELLRLASKVARLGYFELNRKTLEMSWSSQLLDIFEVKRGCEPILGKPTCEFIFKE